MSERIKYPDSWSQKHRDDLDELFVTARRDKKWFCCTSFLVGDLWLSPDELQREQERGKYVWSAENWRLADPRERLAQYDHAIEKTTAERAAFQRRVMVYG